MRTVFFEFGFFRTVFFYPNSASEMAITSTKVGQWGSSLDMLTGVVWAARTGAARKKKDHDGIRTRNL